MDTQERRQAVARRLEEARDLTEDALAEKRQELGELLEKLRSREAVLRTRSAKSYRKSLRILRGNPSARAKDFAEALEALRKLDKQD